MHVGIIKLWFHWGNLYIRCPFRRSDAPFLALVQVENRAALNFLTLLTPLMAFVMCEPEVENFFSIIHSLKIGDILADPWVSDPHVSDPLRFFLFCLFACKVRGRSFKTTSCLRCELQGSATSRHFKSCNLRVRSPQPYGSRKLQIGQIRPKSKEETRTRKFLNIPPA